MNKPEIALKKVCLTVDEVAKALKLTNRDPRQTVLRMAAKGILRGQKCGRSWRFHRQAVEDLLMGGAH